MSEGETNKQIIMANQGKDLEKKELRKSSEKQNVGKGTSERVVRVINEARTSMVVK